ncbi:MULTISPECIES: GrpB family protein [Priestia]|jgi:hypothetical protein|uniref:GrpB family protein n=1 Tax=Priestia megaterium TaxID=1404 RepID=A0ABD4WU71_PRIMG|nr:MULTISPECIES: GrpB family protein [Priestia]MEB2277900.1 GrpB family protein [Bacillus sp. ILBB4]MBV6734400.1 GrpB family protein [Priestia megaterium]MBW0934305.1 GrpB family protein [Priestia megaterium]MCA4156520.1 GrpB family protein [Priestia megaterium]MCR8864376.1 GrpB family protein [Priestia megaterium]
MNITVVEHDPNWKYEYLNEEYLIQGVFLNQRIFKKTVILLKL